MTAAAACARATATASGQSGHCLGGLLSLLFSVHMLSQLFLPHVFIGFGVQNCPPMLGQLIFPKFICVNLVAMVHRHMLEKQICMLGISTNTYTIVCTIEQKTFENRIIIIRRWSPKFMTGINDIIGMNQKIYE